MKRVPGNKYFWLFYHFFQAVIAHFVGSKNIGATHEKKKHNQDNLEQAYIALWEDKVVQVYVRLLFGWIKRQLLWI